jgi:hypothetical protein
MSIIEFNREQPELTHGPVCEKCKGQTRLTGIEPHPTQPHTDLRTYQCLICDAVQAKVIPVAN